MKFYWPLTLNLQQNFRYLALELVAFGLEVTAVAMLFSAVSG